jgi:hypothetical protein
MVLEQGFSYASIAIHCFDDERPPNGHRVIVHFWARR